ncbi:2Fe-2S iron-sulfur cluster-binding protein [Paractinoplanes durhamensis]
MSADAGPFLDFMTDGRAQLWPLPDDYDVLHFPDFDFAVPAGRANFQARLTEQFPDEAKNIDRYFRTVKKAMIGLAARNVLSSFSAPLRRLGFPLVEWLSPATYRTTREQLERSFRDPRLRAIVAARWGLYGTPPGSNAFGYHAAVPTTFFMAGTAHPVGGPRALNRIVLEILDRYGVELRTRQQVRRIVTDGNRVSGVDVEDRATGEEYHVRTPTAVSAAGVRNTYAMLGREPVDLPAEPSAVMLFLGLDSSPARFGVHGENHWFNPDLDGRDGFHREPGDGTLYVSFASLNNPAARFHTVEALELVDPAVFDRWRGTDDQDRPDDYRAFKDDLTRRLIDRLDKQWPGLRDTIAFAELATPLTFENYQHSALGSFYGLAATPQRLRSGLAGTRTPIKGLVVAGQDAWGSGVVGALAGGLMAANAVLKPRQLGDMWRAIRARPVRDPDAAWEGYLRVAGIEELTPAVRKIRLEPMGGGELPFAFAAGQYLKIDLPVAVESIERSYDLQWAGGDRPRRDRGETGPGRPRLHLPARRAPGRRGAAGQRPARRVHLGARAGSRAASAHRRRHRDHSLISVLAAAAAGGHTGLIRLLVGCRTEDEIPYRTELARLQGRLPGLEVVVFLTRPADGWTGRRGRIDLDALRPFVGGVTRVHLCGPAAMMQDLLGALADLDVPREAVHTEAFVSGGSRQTRRERAHAVALAAEQAGITGYAIGVRDEGTTFDCPPGQTVLDAANAAGVPFPQSCGEGACGTCRVRVVAGEYETDTRGMFSAAEIDQGWRLACQTLPTTDLLITRN